MGNKYRRYYIPAGGTLVALFLALQLWGLQIIDVSGDIHCTDTCTSYFDVRNPTYRSIYIYNKESVKLDFSPEIEDYELYVKYYGKWVPMDFTLETRLGNVPKDRIYTFVFPRYSIKHFKLVGHKNPSETIKWGFGFDTEYLDPLWISAIEIGEKIVKEMCAPVYKTWTDETPYYKTCKGFTDPNGTIVEDYECIDYIEKIENTEQVDCIKTGKVNVSGKIYEGNDAFCKLDGNQVCCYSNKEGGEFAATWRTDKSVDKECEDLITGKPELISSSGVRFIK